MGNTWSTVSGMPTPAFSIGAVTIGAAFYAVGGDAFGRVALTRRYTEGAGLHRDADRHRDRDQHRRPARRR